MKRVIYFGVVLALLLVSVFISGCGGGSSTTSTVTPPPTTADPNPLQSGWVRLKDFSTGLSMGSYSWTAASQNTTSYATTVIPPTYDNATGYLSATFPSIASGYTQKFYLESGGTGAVVADLSGYQKLQVKVNTSTGAPFGTINFQIMDTGYGHLTKGAVDPNDSSSYILDLTNLSTGIDLTKVISIAVEFTSGGSGSGTAYITSINALPKVN